MTRGSPVTRGLSQKRTSALASSTTRGRVTSRMAWPQKEIDRGLPEAENKIWHAHPVWFLEGNPVVGYSRLKGGIRLLFWSGQSFDEPGLQKEGSFKAAEARYTSVEQLDVKSLKRWLQKARDIQWDYQHIVRNKGLLARRVPSAPASPASRRGAPVSRRRVRSPRASPGG